MWQLAAGAAIAAGASILGGVIGNALRGMDREKAEALLRQSADAYGQIDLPRLKLLVAEQLPPSEFNQIKDDPDIRAAQTGALSRLKQIADNGGYTLADKVAAAKLGNEVGAQQSAGFHRAAEDAAARGTYGGGSQLATELAASQAGTQAAATQQGDLAARMEQRALQAIMQRGQQAGALRSQDFDEQSRVAAANDEIGRINAQYRTQAAQYNNGLLQQNFQNQMAKTAGLQGANQNVANMYAQNGDYAAQQWAGYGDAAGRAIGGGAGYMFGPGAAGGSAQSSALSGQNGRALAQPVYESSPYQSAAWPGEPAAPRYSTRLMNDDENPRFNRGFGGSY